MEEISKGDILLLEKKQEFLYQRITGFFYNTEFCDCGFVTEKGGNLYVLECSKETELKEYLTQKKEEDFFVYTRKLFNEDIVVPYLNGNKFNKNVQIIKYIWEELNFISSNINKYTFRPNDLSSQRKVIKFNKCCEYGKNMFIYL
jgi:hypothetical protein